MQLIQRDDGSSNDKDGQGNEDPLPINESLSVHSTDSVYGAPQEEAAATPRSVPAQSRAPQVPLETHTETKIVTTLLDAQIADVTPRPKAPRHPSVFVPATPSQNKHKDVFGSGDTDLSEPSDGSDVDSMKALSQKLAARTDSLIAITKRASVLADAATPAVSSGKKTAKRRVLDSGDEEALSSSRKGALGGSNLGANNVKKAMPTVLVSDGDGLPPTPAPLKGKPSRILLAERLYSLFAIEERAKLIKKDARCLDENPKPPARGSNIQKRKREDKDGAEAGEISDAQEKPPLTKRARKTAGRKPVSTKPKAVSPAPLRDSQVLKKSRPVAKKNANYGKRAKAARISSPVPDSAAFPDDDGRPDTLDLTTQPVEPHLESPLLDGDDGDYALVPPAPKPKPKAAPKRKLAKKTAPQENPKADTVKAEANTQIGTRTRATAMKVKGADDEKIVKADPPRKAKAKAKAKRKPDVVPTDEGEGGEGEGGTPKVDLTKDSPAFIEIPSSPPELPQPRPKPGSRVTLQEVLFQFLSFHSRFSYSGANLSRSRNV